MYGHPGTFSRSGTDQNHTQQVALHDADDGIWQWFAVPPGVSYLVQAQVHVEQGAVQMRVGEYRGGASYQAAQASAGGTYVLRMLYTQTQPYAPNNSLLWFLALQANTTFSLDEVHAIAVADTATDPAGAYCFDGLFPSAAAFDAAGGTSTITTSAPDSCQWTASSDASWVTPGAASASGSIYLGYGVAANTTGQSRTATVTVGGVPFTVTQGTAGCFNGVFPSSTTVGSGGGRYTVTTSAPDGCAWTASSDSSWVTLDTTSASGSLYLGFTVAANTTGSARTATLTIGDSRFVVTQDAGTGGASCSYSVSPASATFAAVGGSGSFTVTTGAGCGWAVTSTASWLHVSNASGSGTGTVSYSVDASSDSATRFDVIGGPGFSVAVTQSPAGAVTGSSSCGPFITPFYVLFGSGGGSQVINILSDTTCTSAVTGWASWLSLDRSQGSGTWSLTVSAGANFDAGARTSYVQIGGATLIVDQNAAGVDGGFQDLSGGLVNGDFSHSKFIWSRDPMSGIIKGFVTIPTCCAEPPPPILWDPVPSGPTDPFPCPVVRTIGRSSPFRAGCQPDDSRRGDDIESGENYSAVDITVIARHEGGNRLVGYWPGGDRSGVTIAIGFDIGQHSVADLQALGLSSTVINLLAPYTGLIGQAAADYLAANPLILTTAQTTEINNAVFDSVLNSCGSAYTAASLVGPFGALPGQAQTIIADLWFNLGNLSASKGAPTFWSQVTTGDWWGAYNNLLAFAGGNPNSALNNRARSDAAILFEALNAGTLPWGR